jgi:hypothetical protein
MAAAESSGSEPLNIKSIIGFVKSPRTKEDVAWQIYQPLLESRVEGYPEMVLPYVPPLKEIFDLRRSASVFNKRDLSKVASDLSRKLARELDEDQIGEIVMSVLQIIGQTFDIPSTAPSMNRNLY